MPYADAAAQGKSPFAMEHTPKWGSTMQSPHDSLTHTWSTRNLIASNNLNMVDMGSEGCFFFGTTILFLVVDER